MGGWLGGWVMVVRSDGWLVAWMVGWLVGCVVGWWLDGWTSGWMDGCIEGLEGQEMHEGLF